MRTRAALRWTLAPVLLVVYAGVGWLYVIPGFTVESTYGVRIVAEAEYALRVIAPLSAGVCAFLSRPLGRYLDSRATVRSWARGLLSPTWPALGAAAASYLVVIGALAATTGGLEQVFGGRALLMILTGQSVLLGWGVLGLLVGTVAHPLGSPLLAVAVHLLLTWSAGVGPAWPRLLTGIQYGCCTSSQQPRLDSLLFALAVAGTLLLVSVVAVTMRSRRRRRAVAIIGGAVGVSGLVLAARMLPLGEEYVLAEQRADQTVCQAGQPTVCLWPETAEDLSAVSGWMDTAWEAWEQRGLDLDLPATVSDFSADPGTPGLSYQVGSGRAQTVTNAAYAALVTRGGGGPCAFEVQGVQAASVWLARVAGAGTDDLQLAPSVRDQVVDVSRLVPAEQDAWIGGVLAELAGCRG